MKINGYCDIESKYTKAMSKLIGKKYSDYAAHEYETPFANSLLGQDKNECFLGKHNERWTHVPSDPSMFAQRLTLVALDIGKPFSFVDVGCGIGSKLLLANMLVPKAKVSGIEIVPEFANVAKKLVPKADIVLADALKEDYGKYDVIYYYTPLSHSRLMEKLTKRIAKTAKEGAYIFAAYVFDYDVFTEAHKDFKLVYDDQVEETPRQQNKKLAKETD